MEPAEGPLQLLLVRTSAAAADVLETLLEERGALGSAIEKRRGTRLVRLQVYFPPDAEVPLDWVREKLAEIRANGVPVGPAETRLLPVAREDWAESWRRHFHPVQVSPRLWIAPTWEDAVLEPGQSVVRLDPGMAFGWGDHPTTRGCLQMLERIAMSERVASEGGVDAASVPQAKGEPSRASCARLGKGATGPFPTIDVGTGTGILAIRAIQLGMGPVEACDTDPDAVRTARENAELNGAGDRIVVREGTLPPRGAGPYGLILANLFLTVLEALLPRLDRALARGGDLLAAGITDCQEDRFRHAMAARGLEVVDRICEGAQPGARRWPVLRVRKP